MNDYEDFNPIYFSTPVKCEVNVNNLDEEINRLSLSLEEVYNCKRCLKYFKGRVKKKSHSNSQVNCVVDSVECPHCKASSSFLTISDEESMKLAESKGKPDDDVWDDNDNNA